MKYFSCEKYVRLQAVDAASADTADAEWEAATEEYRAAYAAVRDRLPQEVISFVEDHFPHDAEVLILGLGPPRSFTILVKPETPPGRTLVLEYAMRLPPVLRTGLFPKEYRSSRRSWLCDEVDLGADGAGFVHRVLLADGASLTIEFDDLRVTPYLDVEAPVEPERAEASRAIA